jgi:hypothetical protein
MAMMVVVEVLMADVATGCDRECSDRRMGHCGAALENWPTLPLRSLRVEGGLAMVPCLRLGHQPSLIALISREIALATNVTLSRGTAA